MQLKVLRFIFVSRRFIKYSKQSESYTTNEISNEVTKLKDFTVIWFILPNESFQVEINNGQEFS